MWENGSLFLSVAWICFQHPKKLKSVTVFFQLSFFILPLCLGNRLFFLTMAGFFFLFWPYHWATFCVMIVRAEREKRFFFSKCRIRISVAFKMLTRILSDLLFCTTIGLFNAIVWETSSTKIGSEFITVFTSSLVSIKLWPVNLIFFGP